MGYTIKTDRKSNVGVSKSYPAVCYHGTWGSGHYQYAGDFASLNGVAVDYQISDASGVEVVIAASYSGVNSPHLFYRYGTTVKEVFNGSVLNTYTFHRLSPDKYPDLILMDNFGDYVGLVITWDPIFGIARTHMFCDMGMFGSALTSVVVKRCIVQGNYTYFYHSFIRTPFGGASTTYYHFQRITRFSVVDEDGSTDCGVDDIGDMWRVNDAYWVKNHLDHISYSDDLGANWTEISGGDGSTDYTVVATDGTYIYATLSGSDVIWKGTLTNDGLDVEWTSFYDLTSWTFNGMDADESGHYVFGIVSGSNSYLLTLNSAITIIPSSIRVKRRINAVPTTAEILCADNSIFQENMARYHILDGTGTERFRGFPLPVTDGNSVILEGIDRLLRSPINQSLSDNLYDLMNNISVVDELVEGVNNLDDGATVYDQVWGSSVPRSVGMNTLVTMGSAYFRIKVTDVDSYLIESPPTSGKTITFGTTSVELIGSRPATTSQINRLVVYGAYATDVDGAATDGVLQYTPPEDTDDQLLHGVVALYLRRNDILSFAALKAFADELWVHRKVISSIPKIFTLRIASNVWLDAGDTVDITNGQQVDEYLTDGTYIILSADIDLYREEKIIEVSTVISSEFHDYNDSLPILSQMPLSTTDSTQGDAITPTSLTELIGGGGGGAAYVHPNHTGDVTSVADGAQTIANKQTVTVSTPIYTSQAMTVVAAGGAPTLNLKSDDGTIITAIETAYSGSASKLITSAALGAGMVANFMPLNMGAVEGLGDHAYTGSVITATAGENLAIGDFVYFKSDTKLWKAKADAIATAQCIGCVCVAANTNAEATVLIHGFIRDDSFAAMTVGGTIYLSTATAGAEQNTTVASANTHCVCILGVAVAAYILFVKPNSMIIEIIA